MSDINFTIESDFSISKPRVSFKTYLDVAKKLLAHENWLNRDGGEKAIFDGMDLGWIKFDNIDLRYASFRKCKLQNASFVNSNLQHCDFYMADLGGADLSGADISWASLPIWCGLIGMKGSKELAIELLYLLGNMKIEDKEYEEIRNKFVSFANKSKWINVGDDCKKLEEK